MGRLLHLSRPTGLNRLPILLVDGQSFAPGTHEDTLMIPVLTGDHQLVIRPVPQSPIFRSRQQW